MPSARDIRFASLGIAATGDVVAAIPNAKIVVIGYALTNTVATAQSVQFRTTTTGVSGVIGLPSSIGGGMLWDGGPECPAFATGFGEPLNIALGASTAIGGHITYMVVRG